MLNNCNKQFNKFCKNIDKEAIEKSGLNISTCILSELRFNLAKVCTDSKWLDNISLSEDL